jgi:hypothetical protein
MACVETAVDQSTAAMPGSITHERVARDIYEATFHQMQVSGSQRHDRHPSCAVEGVEEPELHVCTPPVEPLCSTVDQDCMTSDARHPGATDHHVTDRQHTSRAGSWMATPSPARFLRSGAP